MAWQFLIDPYPAARAGTPTGGLIEYQRPAGLFSAGAAGDPLAARPKGFLRGFSLPFDPLRVDASHLRVWALLSDPGATVQLQRETARHSWLTIGRLRSNSYAVLNKLLRLRGRSTLRLREGSRTSAPMRVGSRPGRL